MRSTARVGTHDGTTLMPRSPPRAPMLFAREGLGSDYEELVVVQDAPSGLHAIIALHSTKLGPATGGIRRIAYADEEAALADVLRLAGMMTLKCAMADLPAGGGKIVILDSPKLDVAAAYAALGRAIERLGGRYYAGPDVGTGESEMAHVRAQTRHVNAPGNDPGRATAAGVLGGIRGLLRVLDGGESARGKRFVVQGLGSVGFAIAEALLAQGAQVLASDVNETAAARARAAGVQLLAAHEAVATACDVFVPCALGGVLTRETARTLPARGVCGSANNQFADDDAARILHERGVLVAPDFVVNAGAVIEGVLTMHPGDVDEQRIRAFARIENIAEVTADVLQASAKLNVPPHDVALEMARRRLDP